MKSVLRSSSYIIGLVVCTSVLLACQATPSPAGNLQVTEIGKAPGESDFEVIHLNNCAGKENATQISQRVNSIQIEGGGELGVGIEVIYASVNGKYAPSASLSKSQQVTAPPGTNMEFTLEWSLEQRTGFVTKSGESINQVPYKLLIPIGVQINSQRDLGCDGAESTRLPATQTPSKSTDVPPLTTTPIPPPTRSSTNTPIPPPTQLVDTPSGTILEVGQTWREGGLELQLTKADIHVAYERGGNSYPTGFLVTFVLRSNRTTNLSLRYSFDTITSAVDNQNHSLRLWCAEGAMVPSNPPKQVLLPSCPTQQIVLNAKATIGLPLGNLNNRLGFIMVDTNDPNINQIVIKVSGLSSINDARWRIPIDH